MGTDAFDRLTHLFDKSGTRRAALSALLGTAVLGTAVDKTAAKGKGKRRGQRQGRANAEAKTKSGNHCITPDGFNLNEIYGISLQIVTRFCSEVGSGEQWVSPGAPWIMSGAFDAVPEEFEPAGETPLEDFLAKFEAIKYVIDPDTKHEKTVVFPHDGNLFTGPGTLFGALPEEDLDVVSPITLGALKPLSVGEHAVRVFWRLSAMHCDGLGDVVDENCLPGEEFLYSSVRAFTVTPGHN